MSGSKLRDLSMNFSVQIINLVKDLLCLSKPQAWYIIKGGEPPLYITTAQPCISSAARRYIITATPCRTFPAA